LLRSRDRLGGAYEAENDSDGVIKVYKKTIEKELDSFAAVAY
jgi:hypothetical protein